MEFDPDIVITNKIQWDYNPTAYSELGDKTLNKLACFDPAVRSLLEECVGTVFLSKRVVQSVHAYGDKANGKSTFLEMVKTVLGDGNFSALDLAELDERFSVATMAGKLANIGDDISDDFMKGRSLASFKKIGFGKRDQSGDQE